MTLNHEQTNKVKILKTHRFILATLTLITTSGLVLYQFTQEYPSLALPDSTDATDPVESQLPAEADSTTSEAPRLRNSYGFRNLVVDAPTANITLIDYVVEDGDYITLLVNETPYFTNQRLLNRGSVVTVPLNYGHNKIDIIGVKDGIDGITLEVNVAGIGTVNRLPIPEGATASFYITRPSP
ncbi:MAG: hypothetical protein F6K19_15445 [Cyanothece sp. SIO1E1]|nr:hypothetical protein [Cyanothece sp. SIO1E1]